MDTLLSRILESLLEDELIDILPKWQRNYFYDDLNTLDRDFLIKYITKTANELLNDQRQFGFLVFKMSSEDYDTFQKLLSNVMKIDNRKTLIDRLMDRSLNKSIVSEIRRIMGIEIPEIPESRIVESSVFGPEERFFELLDYQVYIKEQVMNVITADKLTGKLIVHMPTGTGKTKTTMHTIVDYWQNHLKRDGLIVWIAHTNTLLEQAEDTFLSVWKHLGFGEISVHRLYDKFSIAECRKLSGIVFIGVQKLISIYKNDKVLFERLKSSSRLVIFDEAHKSTAFETKRALENLTRLSENRISKFLVGLTATPGRNENELSNLELVELYDRKIISIDPSIIEQLRKSRVEFENQSISYKEIIKYFQDRKILSVLKRELIPYDNSDISDIVENYHSNKKNRDGDLNNEMVELFSRNMSRNKKIIEKLVELANDRRQILFFACSVEHGKFITSFLVSHGIKAKEIYGTTSTNERIDIIKKFRKNEIQILVNCGVLTTGFDSTNIDCVFIARPTTSIVLYSQMIGRGLRGPKMGGNETCLLIDMKDNLERYSDEDKAFSYFESYWR